MGSNGIVEFEAVTFKDASCALSVLMPVELSMRNNYDLDAFVMSRIKRDDSIRAVVLDLSKLEYLDSLGIGKLVVLNAQLNAVNIPGVIVGISERVGGVLRLSSLHGLFPFLGSLDEALAHFRRLIA